MTSHVLQSRLWEKFKNTYGTSAIRSGSVLYTKHKIPFTSHYYGYSPRVNPLEIDFEGLKKSLIKENCVAAQFDVPNITTDNKNYKKALSVIESHCTKSPRNEFAKGNFFIDLTKSEENLFSNMHKKHRYNVKYAERKGVTTRISTSDSDFNLFFDTYRKTGERQKFYSRSRSYLEKVWKTFRENNSAFLLIAEYEGKVLAVWMLFVHENILYYPYGGSTMVYKNVHSGCVLGWEAIKFGKEKGCKLFDMWGASEDLSNKDDHYYGFSQFKEKFGAKHVVYMGSYDYIVNPSFYKAFVTANSVRWKLLNLLK